MEKVKISRDQAEAIKDVERRFRKDSAVIHHMRTWTDINKRCLNSLSTDKFIRALYIGYEVEPEFKVGDWARDASTGATIFIDGKQLANNLMDKRHTSIRHATSEEVATEKTRRWWAKHDRDVWELKKYDELISSKRRIYTVTSVTDEGLVVTNQLNTSGFVLKYFEIQDLEVDYRIKHFAQDRKDI